jgi:hypothetical protein
MTEQSENGQEYYEDEYYSEEAPVEYENHPPASENSKRPRLLDSWFIRLTLAAIVLIGIVILLIGAAYIQARSTRDEPLEIRAYPGMQQVSYQKITEGHDTQYWAAEAPIIEVENHYRRQMDECERYFNDLTQALDVESPSYVNTTCWLDHSHDMFNILQYVKLIIQPEFNAEGQPTGRVYINIERVWGE